MLFCYLDLTGVLTSTRKGKRGSFYLAVVFCYLGLTEVLASPRQGVREIFTCRAVLLPGSHWSFGQPTAGEKRRFYLAVLFCYLDLTEVLASPRKGDRGGFYLAALFCYLDLTEVLASLGRGERGGRGSLILLPVVTLKG